MKGNAMKKNSTPADKRAAALKKRTTKSSFKGAMASAKNASRGR